MATDTITGIRIGGITLEEGRLYRNFPVPQFLEQFQLKRAARVVLDITGQQLTITMANRAGTLVGRVVLRGRAQIEGGAGGIASDFRVRQVAEASQTLGAAGSQLRLAQNTARQGFSFNRAYRETTGGSGSGSLAGVRWQAEATRQVNSTSAITFTSAELEPQLGPLAPAFAGEWWAAVV